MILSGSLALITILGMRKVFGGSDAYRKLLEHQRMAQSIEVTPGKSGEGGTRRNVQYKDTLKEVFDPEIRTLYEMFNKTVEKGSNNQFLGNRKKNANGAAGPYEWNTYGQAKKLRDDFASGLLNLGHRPDEPIGIYSINRAEWIITDLAASAIRAPSISLYDTLGQNAIEFIIKHADIKVVVCAGKQLPNLLAVAPNCPNLKIIISMDPLTDQQRANAGTVKLYTFKEIAEDGAKKPREQFPPRPQDIYTIMYTSGTTGDPKGVILTHGNLIAELAGVLSHEKDLFNEKDYHMSYLPLAHSFERVCSYAMIACGAKIGFFQGNINELFNDIAELKPTFLIGAPRVWSRLHDKLLAAINGGSYIKKQMFHMGFQSKKEALKQGQSSTFWDTILFSKMKARLGGRVRWIMSGSAPLDPNLAEFLKICFCCPVMEGYGLTENAAGACVTKLDETQFGHVGRPLACTEIKLQDVPEMNYTSKNRSGEIMLRGPNIFKGYFKDPEKTKEAIDPDGFFHTGDIGRWNENGTLSIIDRKKNIFKLSQGEYVAVEYLEGVYIRSPFVSQVWVYGSSFKRFLVAVVVPDTDVLMPWAQQNNVAGDVKSLCSDDRINKLILDDITRIGKEAKLHGFEFVKAIHLTSEPFSVENDLTTPTFKLKRPQLLTYFKTQVDEMYAKIGEDSN